MSKFSRFFSQLFTRHPVTHAIFNLPAMGVELLDCFRGLDYVKQNLPRPLVPQPFWVPQRGTVWSDLGSFKLVEIYSYKMRFHAEDFIFQVEIFGFKRFLNGFEFQWHLITVYIMIINTYTRTHTSEALHFHWYLPWAIWAEVCCYTFSDAAVDSAADDGCVFDLLQRIAQALGLSNVAWMAEGNGDRGGMGGICAIFLPKGLNPEAILRYFVFRINMQIWFDSECKMRVSNNVTTCLCSDFCRICCHFT